MYGLQTANIIFVDFPVGAGFSYATSSDAWSTTDTESAQQAHYFLRNVRYDLNMLECSEETA